MSKFKPIIDKLFDSNKSFKKEDFLEFISDLTSKYPDNIITHPVILDSQSNKYFREDICIFEDKSGEKIAIMSYKMPSASKVEKARSHQRNLISNYLKNEGVYDDVDSVLVAFYSENNPDWRLSFIKQEFKLSDTELDAKGRKKIINELTPAKRYSFLVDTDSKNITVKQRLTELLDGNKSILDIEKAFSVEKVSKEFFDKYVKLYEKLTKAFEKDRVFTKIESESNHGDDHFKENFVKKLLGQIVFLYFLQKKGWLGVKKDGKWGEGNKRFMQDLLKECLEGGDSKKELGGKNFFNDYLEHLFYDFLNKNEKDRKEPDYFNCKIPYLNGGLFEPMNSYEWRGLDYVILSGEENNLLFKEIFDTFDEYNFTVYENDPLEQDVAVDPEMLGKVFENLLPENERKGKGAFYTPREIVHYMCKESLKNHIINKTGISEELINTLFEYKDSYLNITKKGAKILEDEKYEIFSKFIDYAGNIVECLKTVKIVDPAVGSGAFPMGLLKEIVSLRKYLQENILLEDNVSEYKIKKETLENCIYGVDLDPGAVEIAKLRFWLSLVIEEESGDKIDPLPNLDYKIMQGNSLIEDIVVGDTVIKIDVEINGKKITKKAEADFKREEKKFNKATQGTMSLFADESIRDDILKRLKFLHKIFFQEKDNNKKKVLKKEIDHIEKELIRISGEVEVNKLQAQIENIEGKYILSGMAWDEKDAKKVATWQSTIASIKEMEKKYEKDNIRSFFPWKLHFGEVFNENGGFDIVIGNPPYVGQKNNNSIFQELKKIPFGLNFHQRRMDYFYFFFHKGLDILRKSGILGYITTNYYFTSTSADKLRIDLNNRGTIKNIINFNELRIFDSAKGQHNAILILTKEKLQLDCKIINVKSKIKYNNTLSTILSGNNKDTFYTNVNNNDIYEGKNMYIRTDVNGDNNINFLNKLLVKSILLGEIAYISTGIQTGADKVKNGHILKYDINNNIGDGIFILDNNELSKMDFNNDEKLLLKPWFKNSDIKKWKTNSKINERLIYITSKLIYKNIDNILEHLTNFKKILINRNTRSGTGIITESQYDDFVEGNTHIGYVMIASSFKKGNFFCVSYSRDESVFEGPKIVVPQRSKYNTFGYNEESWYSGTDTHIIANIKNGIDIKYILGLLNSKLYYTWLYYKGKRKGENLELIRTPLAEIPIKQISPEEQKPFVDLVEQILEITKNEDYLEKDDLKGKVKVLESRIDDMVYELYGLSEEEVELVEESLK